MLYISAQTKWPFRSRKLCTCFT